MGQHQLGSYPPFADGILLTPNSNGRTPGIANPNSESQAAAIRLAYACAGITDYNETAYLECHGTGTQAGDPTEVGGAGTVFSASRDASRPLIIGSVSKVYGEFYSQVNLFHCRSKAMLAMRSQLPVFLV